MKFNRKKLKLRLYQQAILGTAIGNNTLVVIPTGLGKTIIAAGLVGLLHEKGRVLFMAPTKPLCVQHSKTFEKFFDGELEVLTGAIPPDKRKKLWKSEIIFATPQTVANDLLRGLFNFDDFSLVIFDEAHRAIGEYSYVWLAKQAKEKCRIMALTASPASDKEKLDEIKSNLFISEIEVRTEKDKDVESYVKGKKIERVYVELPEEFKEIKDLLERSLKSRLRILYDAELINSLDLNKIRKKDFLMLQGQLSREVRKGEFNTYKQISIVASCLKIMHCLELLQSHGIGPMKEFFKKLEIQSRTVKAAKNLLSDWNFKKAMILSHRSKEEHPKLKALEAIVRKHSGKRIIIFTQYRSSVDQILEKVCVLPKTRAVKFIGQREGLSQKKQVEVLEKFKEGDYNILVATSISEEGLHIENADVGVFYEPVASALRTIQRRGRIGRVNFGKVYMLITKGTIDEKYYWVAHHKERRMYMLLDNLKKGEKQQTL
jgi:Fanconi anemia group M protein